MANKLLILVIALFFCVTICFAGSWRRCPKCDGKTKIKRSYHKTCRPCHGSGEKSRIAWQETPCTECDAFGYKYYLSFKRCNCSGRSDCSKCEGTKELPKVKKKACLKCRGKQTVKKPYYVKSTCETCAGKKTVERLKFMICGDCAGRGFVRRARRPVRKKRKR